MKRRVGGIEVEVSRPRKRMGEQACCGAEAGAHKPDCRQSGRVGAIPTRDAYPPVPAERGSLAGRLGPVADALCMTPEALAHDTITLLACGGPAAYLRWLRSKDPVAWRERVKAVYAAESGNGAAVARRLGLTPPGLSKLVASDDELRQAIAIRWPHAQRPVTRNIGGHTDQR